MPITNRISAIVAVASNGVIGNGGTLPWHVPADLAQFKQRTLGHTVIMGRKTYESIGKALPERSTIIVSNNPNYHAPDCFVVTTKLAALTLANQLETNGEIFVIGGGTIFTLFADVISRLYITRIALAYTGDVYWNELTDFTNIISYASHLDAKVPYEVFTYERSL